MAGGLEGRGPSQPLPAVNRPHFTAPPGGRRTGAFRHDGVEAEVATDTIIQ